MSNVIDSDTTEALNKGDNSEALPESSESEQQLENESLLQKPSNDFHSEERPNEINNDLPDSKQETSSTFLSKLLTSSSSGNSSEVVNDSENSKANYKFVKKDFYPQNVLTPNEVSINTCEKIDEDNCHHIPDEVSAVGCSSDSVDIVLDDSPKSVSNLIEDSTDRSQSLSN